MMPTRPTSNGDDDDADVSPFERRRYPSPELEIGLVAAARIAGILFVPMGVVATIFGVYLQGFRADLRLDIQKVVTDAIDKHVAYEKANYATVSQVTSLDAEMDRLRRDHDDLSKQVGVFNELLQRLAQKNGMTR